MIRRVDVIGSVGVVCARVAQPLKDVFFQRAFFERLASEIERVHRPFDRQRFLAMVFDRAWKGRELKGRMRHASEALGQALPSDFREALAILLQVEGRFDGFDHLLFADFVERFGLDDYEASIAALEVLTRTTAEFAIRPFIRRYPTRTLDQMRAWCRHPSERVRRLASEGSRPRLPWGMALPALIEDPAPILPILDSLKDDPSDAVRRSAANSLGDVAKDHPELALELAERWMTEAPTRAPWLKHALRALLKRGDPRALSLFGFGGSAGVDVVRLAVTPRRVSLGGRATLHVELRSTRREPQRIRLEYEIEYARPTGRSSPKVFQIAETDLGPRAELRLERRLSFADRSTRCHHAGRHIARLVINGRRLGSARFELA